MEFTQDSPIPKKMKRLIDGDLASLRDIRKMSTRDRLKEKLKERQKESQNALESKVNAAEETGENGLNKLKRQRKRKKKSKRTDESPSVYLNNEHDKDVTKEENCHQHCENTHVKQHHTSDEAEKNNENMISKVQLGKTNKGHEEVAATSKVEKEAYDPKVDDTEFTKTNAADGNCIQVFKERKRDRHEKTIGNAPVLKYHAPRDTVVANLKQYRRQEKQNKKVYEINRNTDKRIEHAINFIEKQECVPCPKKGNPTEKVHIAMEAGKNDTFVSNRVVSEQTSKESRTLINEDEKTRTYGTFAFNDHEITYEKFENDCKILANFKDDDSLLDENVGCKVEPVPPDILVNDKNHLHQYAVEKASNIQSEVIRLHDIVTENWSNKKSVQICLLKYTKNSRMQQCFREDLAQLCELFNKCKVVNDISQRYSLDIYMFKPGLNETNTIERLPLMANPQDKRANQLAIMLNVFKLADDVSDVLLVDDGKKDRIVTKRLQCNLPNNKGNDTEITIEVMCNYLKMYVVLSLESPNFKFNRNAPLANETSRSFYDTCNKSKAGLSLVQNKSHLSTVRDIVYTHVGREMVSFDFERQNTLRKKQKLSDREICLESNSILMNKQSACWKSNFSKLPVTPLKTEEITRNILQGVSKELNLPNDVSKARTFGVYHVHQRLKNRNPNNDIKAFLSKLHTDMFKNLKQINGISQKKQNIETSRATSMPEMVSNPDKCGSFGSDKNGTRDRKEVREPKRFDIENIRSDHSEQSCAQNCMFADEEQEQQSNDNDEIKIIETVEQIHYGIRLCMFD